MKSGIFPVSLSEGGGGGGDCCLNFSIKLTQFFFWISNDLDSISLQLSSVMCALSCHNNAEEIIL